MRATLTVEMVSRYCVPSDMSDKLCIHLCYRDVTKRSASHTLAYTQVTHEVHYEQALSNAIHYTSNVNLLQASVEPCCNLPTQSTFILLLLCLPLSNSSPDNDTTQNSRCSNSQIPQITTSTTDYY